jgi:hypothetical protein
MDAAEMDTPAGRLKQRLTVSYAEYRELEKSWTAARELVRMYSSVLHSSSQQAVVRQPVWHKKRILLQSAYMTVVYPKISHDGCRILDCCRWIDSRLKETICSRRSTALRRPGRYASG